MGTLLVALTVALAAAGSGRYVYGRWRRMEWRACKTDPHDGGSADRTEEQRVRRRLDYRLGMLVMYTAFSLLAAGAALSLLGMGGGGWIIAGSYLGFAGYGLTERARRAGA